MKCINWFKRITSIALVFVIVFSFTAIAKADIPYYNQANSIGVVICTRLNVRLEPRTSANSIGTLTNGQSCIIVGEYGDWYAVDLASLKFKDAPSGIGYIKKGLLQENPQWIILTKYTELFTDPWGSGKKNGEQSKRALMVIARNNYYFCVQCTESSAGSAFVRISDVGQYSQQGTRNYVVIQKDIPLVNTNGEVISNLKRFEVVRMYSYGTEYSYVYTESNLAGYVETRYLGAVIN